MLASFFRQLLRSRRPQPLAAPPAQALISAIALQQAGEHEQAVAVCRGLLEKTPEDANALHLLGSNLLALERFEEAAHVLRQATALEPASAEAHYNLALAQKAHGDANSALASFRSALERKPEGVEACVGAGTILYDQGALDEAERLFRQALARRPRFAEAHYSLGVALAALQRLPEAIEHHRAALASDPRFMLAHTNLLFLLNAHASSPQAVYDEHRAWAMRQAQSHGGAVRHGNTADPERRLRVGYVSADLWDHPVARFIEPVLAHHDREAFEIICYHSSARADAVTARLKARAQHWIECAHLSDDALAARIRADGIDLLVDLGGHTAGNRLLALADKPAPVQATYLGYPTTTGLSAIDYRITDWTVDPPGSEALNAEVPVRLPHSYFCYAADDTPAAGPLSAKARGCVTFGSFNACIKWSDETLALWARVLNAVPEARLVLKAKDLTNARIRERVLERFAALGLASGHITLQGWEPHTAEHLSAYGAIDIALDTYPYNGATTTCEALWMGVPVVTLKGSTHASRMAASALAAAGLHELIAETAEGYVALCTGLAADFGKLAALRAGLRARLRASPLMDGAAFTTALEREYRRMWQAWCTRR